METIYFTLKDYQPNYPKDLELFLNDFEGCDESDFIDKQLDIYGVLHKVLLYSDSATDYIEHFYNSDKFKTVNPKVVSSIFERVADGDPPESGLQPSFNVTSGTVVYSGVFNNYKKERLQSSFWAIIQFLFSKLAENGNGVNSFDYSTLKGMKAVWTKEQLATIHEKASHKFLDGNLQDFLALCNYDYLPGNFNPIIWKKKRGKSFHKNSLAEFIFYLTDGKSPNSTTTGVKFGAELKDIAKTCFIDANGLPLVVEGTGKGTSPDPELSKIFSR